MNSNIYKYGFLVAIIAVCALIFKSCEDSKELSFARTEDANLRKALQDSVHTFQNTKGEWVNEKRTLQTSISTLEDKNLNLSGDVKALISSVKEQNKNDQTIAAALIKLQAEVKDLKNNKPIEQTDSTVRFADEGKDFQYDLTVFNVKPIELKTPTLSLHKISFPNTQIVSFVWLDNKKEGYPVSFKVVNSNPYFKVANIESYAIPELTREKVKPTFWQKVNNGSKTTVGKIVIFGLGLGVGAAVVK